ncbi:probable G-protein coupled receptor CG31760 [Orbicella faveolata]|uniref:probable G-protein coupled receptor CG31760 n=1 Tax=Orbicella faveolata TaxID=48498 RepID=UPI0009E5F243|nr:probable G-protein coupled receptor CG31760 [Orbicella faveolata]
MFLCFRVRNAPSAYNETRFISWAVYNAMFITCFVGVLRILTVNNTNPDILFATEFILIQMTATVTILLLFIPKFVLLRKISGQEISRRLTGHPRGSIQTPNGSCLNDAATLERENEDLKDEVKRLALKVAYLHSCLMKDKNKHLKSASNSLCRVRAATMDDFNDSTLKKMSSSPVSRFLSSHV